jgi:hypothetical protein
LPPSGQLLTLVSRADSSEDGVGGFGPDERLGLVIGLGDEAVDGGLQLDDRGEDAALEALPGEARTRTPARPP